MPILAVDGTEPGEQKLQTDDAVEETCPTEQLRHSVMSCWSEYVLGGQLWHTCPATPFTRFLAVPGKQTSRVGAPVG